MVKRTPVLFFLFILVWLVKNILIVTPLGMDGVFICKLLYPVLIGSLLFITRRQLWSVILMWIYDLIIIASVLYYRANHILPDLEVAISNSYLLKVHGDSLTTYFSFALLIFPALSAIYTALYIFVQRIPASKKMPLVTGICVVLFFIGTFFYTCLERWNQWYGKNPGSAYNIDFYYRTGQPYAERFGYKAWKTIVPFGQLGYGVDQRYFRQSDLFGFQLVSVLDYIVCQIRIPHPAINDKTLAHFVSPDPIYYHPTEDLYIFIIESFESWVLDYCDLDGNLAMPNLRAWMDEGATFYSDRVIPQVRHGVSADGEMIIVTGLLPLQHGTACLSYCHQYYPSFAHLYHRDALITCHPGWNKWETNTCYGIDTMYCGPYYNMYHDTRILPVADSLIKDNPLSEREAQLLFIANVDTHTPFHNAEEGKLRISTDMDENHRLYLQCMNVLDSQLAPIFEHYRRSEVMQQAHIVITGDHTIFRADTIYCPLIIRSPRITENIVREEPCYQMDIYPTILGLLRFEEYEWKGFGIDLLNPDATRHISEQDAYEMSDAIIRNAYFHRPE